MGDVCLPFCSLGDLYVPFQVFRVWRKWSGRVTISNATIAQAAASEYFCRERLVTMHTVTGIFSSQKQAESAVSALRSTGNVSLDKITLLTPGNVNKELESVPVVAAEQPGMAKAIGAVLGGAGGLSTGAFVAAVIPGVGLVSALGLLGTAILTAAGAGVGAAAGGSLENRMTEGLPEDEIFLYEDALRKGFSVVVVLADDVTAAEPVRELLKVKGADAIDAARQQWWIGLRSAEQEHYAASGRNFNDDETFYRMGFEAALHAKTRCLEFDQTSAEMESKLEELRRKHPGAQVAEAYTRGYQRGREYYQRLCDESKAA